MLRRSLLFVLLLSSFALAQAKRPFTFEDMMALKRVGDPQVSPDGKWVLFSAVDVNLEKNTRTPHLWVVPVAGGESRQITSDSGESRGRWSPDGKHFAFLSSKGGAEQVWVADFDGASGAVTGAPRQVTTISTEADGELWSPDGKHILFTSSVYPDCADDACNQQRDEAAAKSPVKAQIWTHLLFRHWNAYLGGKYSHIFVQPVAADGAPTGAARDLTPGAFETPVFSLGGPDGYAFSPDGQEICFVSNHDAMPADSTNNDLWLVSVNGGEPKDITAANKASDSGPLYSPDGKYIAYLGQQRPGYESDRFRLMLYERATGKIANLTENFDRWVGTFVWAPDSKSLYFSAEDKGDSPIYQAVISVCPTPGKCAPTVEELTWGSNDELSVSPDGKTLLFSQVSVQAPSEVFFADLTTVTPCRGRCARHSAHRLTHLNDAVLAQVQMQPLEPFWFTGAEQKKVEGFLVKPPNFDPAKKYPVKFLVHGGPQGAWGDSWSYRWNPELFAASGYVVVMINPRGSTGYGQQFIDDINGDWGGRVYQDLMMGLDYAEKTYPFLDKNRECALGASYGGYMMNWMLGHTTHFKCIVSHDGMFNADSAWGSTEELWFNEWEFKGMPWTNRALYQKWSPHQYAANFKTPTLVIHSQRDYRLDVSEGFQLFTTLQRLGVPSKMLYFPDEGHWVLKPQNSRLWWQTEEAWVDQWTKK
ncbi:MAG TPA: S9 family peptidase [Terriglobales bacterium]|nr:S9 family peptidase [Terriglobales bacterium]